MSLPYSAVPPLAAADTSASPTGPDWQAAFAQLSASHESQRRQAARIVHDRVAQALAAIKMSAYLCLVEDDPQQIRRDLEHIKQLAAQTAQEVRSLEHALRPPQLDTVGLESALRAETEHRFHQSADIALQLQIEPLPQSPAPEVAIGCVRVVQYLFDALSVEPGPAGLTVSVQGSDEARFMVQVRVAWLRQQDRQPWPEAAWFALAEAMVAHLGGVLSTDAEGTQQTLRLSLPYRHVDPSTTA